jgi:hypothetical protein
MPGSVANAAPVTTMPWGLCKAFGHAREFAILENEYKDGTSQRSRLSETSRKRWQITKRLTPTALEILRDHYIARKGPTEPFYFYDHTETIPKFSSAPSGSSGCYIVRYDCSWEQMAAIGRADVQIAIVEIT